MNRMDMRFFTKITAAFAIILISSVCTSAQTKEYSQDIGFTAGTYIPMDYSDESDMIVGVTYGRFYPGGCGFRTGFQYSPGIMDIDHYFGVPLVFAFRTGSKSTSERFDTAIFGTADTYYDDVYWDRGVSAGGMIANFLVNFFSGAELFAGITPGYVAGKSGSCWGINPGYTERWTEKPHSFSMTLDAGGSLNYSIWRFDLKVIPAFHYSLTDNYDRHSALIDLGGKALKEKSEPVRWFFSISGGLAFRF